MDTCRLTKEQVAALAAGTTVRTKYESPEEYGYVASRDIAIVPPPDGSGDSSGGARRRMDDNLNGMFGDDQGERPC